MIATDVKGILTIKFKPRTDHLTDQYSRIFMVKLLLACTVVTGISWYTDKMNCIIPSKGLKLRCLYYVMSSVVVISDDELFLRYG